MPGEVDENRVSRPRDHGKPAGDRLFDLLAGGLFIGKGPHVAELPHFAEQLGEHAGVAVAAGQVHPSPVVRPLVLGIELVVGHPEEDAKAFASPGFDCAVGRVGLDVDVVLGPVAGVRFAQIQRSPFDLLRCKGRESRLAEGRIRQLAQRLLRGNDLDHLPAERRLHAPAKQLALGRNLHGLPAMYPVGRLETVGEDQVHLAVGLLVDHVQVRVHLAGRADRQRVAFPVTAGRLVDLGPDQERRLAVANVFQHAPPGRRDGRLAVNRRAGKQDDGDRRHEP